MVATTRESAGRYRSRRRRETLGEEGEPWPDPTGQASCSLRKTCPRVAGAQLSGFVASGAKAAFASSRHLRHRESCCAPGALALLCCCSPSADLSQEETLKGQAPPPHRAADRAGSRALSCLTPGSRQLPLKLGGNPIGARCRYSVLRGVGETAGFLQISSGKGGGAGSLPGGEYCF